MFVDELALKDTHTQSESSISKAGERKAFVKIESGLYSSRRNEISFFGEESLTTKCSGLASARSSLKIQNKIGIVNFKCFYSDNLKIVSVEMIPRTAVLC